MTQEKVIEGLEKLANAEGYKLEITTKRGDHHWIITFRAGNAAVQMYLGSFARAPHRVLEPFCEEMCKQIRAGA